MPTLGVAIVPCSVSLCPISLESSRGSRETTWLCGFGEIGSRSPWLFRSCVKFSKPLSLATPQLACLVMKWSGTPMVLCSLCRGTALSASLHPLKNTPFQKLLYVYECSDCTCICAPHVCCAQGGQRILWNWSYSCALLCGCRELNPGSLESSVFNH